MRRIIFNENEINIAQRVVKDIIDIFAYL